MAYRWETPASVWLEDESSGRFALLATEGLGQLDWQAQARNRLPDVARLLGASLPASCGCAPVYPEGFAFCPNCGQPLARPEAACHPDWWGPHADQLLPRHVPHGLPVTSLPLGDSIEQRPAAPAPGRAELSLPAPPNAHCVFAAAHYGFGAQRLLALAFSRGVLQYWDPLARLWQVLSPEDATADLAFTASAYAWLPASSPRRGEVALVPTRQGLSRLWIDPVGETFRLEPVFDAPLAASPGAMRRHIGCLFAGEGGALRLWAAHSDLPQTEVHECGALPPSGWSRPVGYDGRVAWLHEQGQLVWRPGAAPSFIPWPQGWRASFELGGPVQSRDGRLWHIGHDGQRYSFVELGTARPQCQPVDGARLGFAGLLFRRGHPVLDEPWSGEHVEDPQQDDSLVLPLLRAFDGNGGRTGGLVLRLHRYTGRAEDALAGRAIARATVEWIGRRNVILDEVARLARPPECVPFVYDGCLWLHHPGWSQVRGWRLDGLP